MTESGPYSLSRVCVTVCRTSAARCGTVRSNSAARVDSATARARSRRVSLTGSISVAVAVVVVIDDDDDVVVVDDDDDGGGGGNIAAVVVAAPLALDDKDESLLAEAAAAARLLSFIIFINSLPRAPLNANMALRRRSTSSCTAFRQVLIRQSRVSGRSGSSARAWRAASTACCTLSALCLNDAATRMRFRARSLSFVAWFASCWKSLPACL